ncbi:MAG: 23S rRNA (adenine(2503)-C(2))-methyltransferase RlmN [bacterium]
MVGNSPPAEGGTPARPRLLDLSMERLAEEFTALGEPGFRAKQVYDWLHVKNVHEPAQMTNLPATLRDKLAKKFDHAPLRQVVRLNSQDGSIKYAFLTRGNDPIESVVMPSRYGCTLCISSQSGCPMACKFCETGHMGLRSWLSAGEILQQLYLAEQDSGQTVDRIVFMGMGEPLLNLRALRRVVEILCGEQGRNWSPRRITVSTVGIVQPMLKLADTFPRVNLALSLHFTTEGKRREQMPEATHDITELMAALYYYRRVNGGKVSIEYTLISGSNDSDDDARRLVDFARFKGLPQDHPVVLDAEMQEKPARMQPLPVHVNLISYNPIPSAGFRGTSEERIDHFAQHLASKGVPVTVRRSRGQDVGAACGQLGGKFADN